MSKKNVELCKEVLLDYILMTLDGFKKIPFLNYILCVDYNAYVQ